MWFREEEAFKRHPHMKQKIDGLIQKERATRMNSASIRKIIKHVDQNATAPEDRYFRRLHDDVFKTLGDHSDWAQAGLEAATKSHFVKRFVPGWSPLEKKLGLTNPCPDHVYGIKAATFEEPYETPSDEVRAIMAMSGDPQILHAFFAVEDKGSDGLFAEAINQAIRDGAAMVNAKLSLKQHLGNLEARVRGEVEDYEPPLGADPDALAFTCCWGPELADLYVHWYEKKSEQSEIFHIHRLGRYMVDNEDHLVNFRRDAHNVLDYGMLEHRQTMEGIVKQIVNLERELVIKGTEKGNGKGKGKGKGAVKGSVGDTLEKQSSLAA